MMIRMSSTSSSSSFILVLSVVGTLFSRSASGGSSGSRSGISRTWTPAFTYQQRQQGHQHQHQQRFIETKTTTTNHVHPTTSKYHYHHQHQPSILWLSSSSNEATTTVPFFSSTKKVVSEKQQQQDPSSLLYGGFQPRPPSYDDDSNTKEAKKKEATATSDKKMNKLDSRGWLKNLLQEEGIVVGQEEDDDDEGGITASSLLTVEPSYTTATTAITKGDDAVVVTNPVLASQGDWTAYFDAEGTGLVYYFNDRSGESQWTPPLETDTSTPFPPVRLNAEQLAVAQKRQEEYLITLRQRGRKIQHYTEGTTTTNAATTASTKAATTSTPVPEKEKKILEAPTKKIEDLSQQRPLAVQGSWSAYWDRDDTEYIYYYNDITGMSQWMPPTNTFPIIDTSTKTKTGGRIMKTLDSTVITSEVALAVEGDWHAYFDDNTALVYYHNVDTGLSQWDKPTKTFPNYKLTYDMNQRMRVKRHSKQMMIGTGLFGDYKPNTSKNNHGLHPIIKWVISFFQKSLTGDKEEEEKEETSKTMMMTTTTTTTSALTDEVPPVSSVMPSSTKDVVGKAVKTTFEDNNNNKSGWPDWILAAVAFLEGFTA